MQHKRVLLMVIMLGLASLACTLPFIGGREQLPSLPELVPPELARPEESGESVIDQLFESISDEPNPNPVSFNRGLSTLNAYKVVGEIEIIGPSTAEITRTRIIQENDQNLDATFRTMTTFEQTLDDPEPQENTMYIWRVGNDTCNGSEDSDDYEFETMEPDLREISDVLTDIFDMTFLVENPQFAGEEVINGVICNHFLFQLSGLGVTSGATVLNNQGEYWLAKDGDYIVKYYLLIETSTSPEKINHLKVTMELSEINQPRTMSMPQGCYDAQFDDE